MVPLARSKRRMERPSGSVPNTDSVTVNVAMDVLRPAAPWLSLVLWDL